MPERWELLDNAGAVIDLRYKYIVDQIDGLGMPDVQHISQSNAQQDGESYIASYLRKRTVTFSLNILNVCEAELWDMREELVILASQLSTGFKLRGRLPNGNTRQIDLRYEAGLTLPRSRDMNSNTQKLAIQARTFDNPTWYDPNLVQLFFTVSGGAGGWGFPLGFPAGFGGSVIAAPAAIVYPGTWRTYPIIKINGPAADVVIENTTTGEKLDFTGYTIGAGQLVTIDLTPNHKTVTDNTGANLVDKLTTDSDLGSFHIERAPEAPGGSNAITVTATGGTPATWIGIEYYTRYAGI